MAGSAQSSQQLDSRAIEGWAALERGDIQGARAALQDVYSANPSHPALPLLAAGIRRLRPKPVPWGAVALLLVLIAGGALGLFSWAARRHPPASTSAQPAVSSRTQEAEAPSSPPPAERPRGTSGGSAQHSPSSRDAPAAADDAQIRQAVTRFARTYSSKWATLSFSGCDISPVGDTATATCRATPASSTNDAETAPWTFSCRKTAGSWKIISVQPPPLP
jgi:hypothetical protein